MQLNRHGHQKPRQLALALLDMALSLVLAGLVRCTRAALLSQSGVYPPVGSNATRMKPNRSTALALAVCGNRGPL